MKSSTINTTLGLIALATMSFAASNAQANHDTPQRFDPPYNQTYGQTWNNQGQVWNGRGNFGRRYAAQRAYQQRLAEIDARQAQQQERIQQGWHNGDLTHSEYHALLSEQQNFDTVKRDFMSDGFLTQSESQQLQNGLDAADRNIQMEKHDHETRISDYGNSRYGHRWGYDR